MHYGSNYFSTNYYTKNTIEVGCAVSYWSQGRSQDLVSGGGPTHFGGGPTPYFSPQTPNHKGPPLCTFGYPRISGGGPGPPPPPPGYALDWSTGKATRNLR